MTTTYLEIERFAGRLHAQIELRITGRVVPAEAPERDRGGGWLDPGHDGYVEDLDAEVESAAVSLADEDELVFVFRTPAGSQRVRDATCDILVRLGFSLAFTPDERARAEDQLREAWEAEREPDPDRWRDERIDREMTERRSA